MNFEEIISANSLTIPDDRVWHFLSYEEVPDGGLAKFVVEGYDFPEYIVSILVENAGNPLWSNLKVHCTCPQYQYRVAWADNIRGIAAPPYETRPSDITNPDYEGTCCKHIMSVLRDWPAIVATYLLSDY